MCLDFFAIIVAKAGPSHSPIPNLSPMVCDHDGRSRIQAGFCTEGIGLIIIIQCSYILSNMGCGREMTEQEINKAAENPTYQVCC